MWPFKSENRASGGFTDLFVNQLLAQAGGNVYADVSNTAAAELVAGLWGRAFASASLSPAFPGIGPDTLEAIARAMILDGEYLGAIDVSDGALRLLQSYSWDVVGGANPRTWRYSLELPGPSGNETRQLPPEGVVSCRWATSRSAPHRGCRAVSGELADGGAPRQSRKDAGSGGGCSERILFADPEGWCGHRRTPSHHEDASRTNRRRRDDRRRLGRRKQSGTQAGLGSQEVRRRPTYRVERTP